MPKLPRVTAKRMVAALRRAGFVVEVETNPGSHLGLRHPDTGKRITVPMHDGDMATGTIRAILRQTGISVEGYEALVTRTGKLPVAPDPTKVEIRRVGDIYTAKVPQKGQKKRK